MSGRERGARRAQYLPIAEHGLIGDLHTVALVGTVLDFSPYLRPREWAVAIVVADAVLWNGADLLLAESFAATAGGRDLLAERCFFAWSQSSWPPSHGTARISDRTGACCRLCVTRRRGVFVTTGQLPGVRPSGIHLCSPTVSATPALGAVCGE